MLKNEKETFFNTMPFELTRNINPFPCVRGSDASLAESRSPNFSACGYTQRIIFQILSNQPEIRLYLPFSGWFGTKRTSVWFQINRKMVNTTWFQVDLIRFRKDFSVSRPEMVSFICWHLCNDASSWNPSVPYCADARRISWPLNWATMMPRGSSLPLRRVRA